MLRDIAAIEVSNLAPSAPPRRPYFPRAQGRAFEVHAAPSNDVDEIELYDEIGHWGVTAEAFRAALKASAAPVLNLKINSPGGDVFDGIAMFNDLRNHHAQVEVEITGVAASAASIVAMGGNEIAMAFNAHMMIHNSWAVGIGDAGDMFAIGAVLQQIDQSLAKTYAQRSNLDEQEAAALMAATTWLTADEARDKGLADTVTGDDGAAPEASAKFDLGELRNVPAALADWRLEKRPTKRDFEAALRDAGCSRSQARGMLAKGYEAITDDQRDADDGVAAKTSAALARLTATLSNRS